MAKQAQYDMGGDSDVESEDEDDSDEVFDKAKGNDRINEERNSLNPFANEEGASLSLRSYTR